MLALAIASLVAADTANRLNPLDFFQADKLLHIMAYGILSFLWMYHLNRKGRLHSVRNSLIISIVFGILLECAQYGFFTGRRFEFLDIIANIMGAVMGVIFTKYLLKV